MKRIPVAGPWITQKEIDYVTDAVTNAWYENANVYHQRFEKAFAEYIGVRFAVSLPSCTSAIHLSLMALGVGSGDEVIVPEATWIASAAPVSYVGATPIFADIDPLTWCISPVSFEKCISPRTKAVIPVDLYGGVPDWDAVRAIANKHHVFIIEDAAEAIGSEYKGRKAGSFGDTGVFSFHGSKTLTTGEGGMLVTDREDIYQRVLQLRDHGRRPGDTLFWNYEVAHKYKMSSLQAALGVAQLERIEELLARKLETFGWYQEELGDLEDVVLNHQLPESKNTYWMVTIHWTAKYDLSKVQLIAMLKERNIDCRPFFFPLSALPAYENSPDAQSARQRNPVSYQISERSINLPSALNLTKEDVTYVCDVLKDIFRAHAR